MESPPPSPRASPPPAMPSTPTGTSAKREACATTLAKTIAKAVVRDMAKAHAHYQALLNERSPTVIPTSLKVTNGFKVMDPFNWTKDKAIYQRWQL